MRYYQFDLDTYAGDGKCHASPPGSYGHECGKTSDYVSTADSGHRSGTCQECLDARIETSGKTFERITARTSDAAYAYITTK